MKKKLLGILLSGFCFALGEINIASAETWYPLNNQNVISTSRYMLNGYNKAISAKGGYVFYAHKIDEEKYADGSFFYMVHFQRAGSYCSGDIFVEYNRSRNVVRMSEYCNLHGYHQTGTENFNAAKSIIRVAIQEGRRVPIVRMGQN